MNAVAVNSCDFAGMPADEELFEELKILRDFIHKYRQEVTQVHLQVYDNGKWELHSGDAPACLDGFWGTSALFSTHHDDDVLLVVDSLKEQVNGEYQRAWMPSTGVRRIFCS